MNQHQNVRPISPVAGYVAGKRQLAKRLVGMIGGIDHTTYAEPFVGMGGIFFRREARPRAEAINDLSQDVATFFRILQRHYEPFLDMLKWRLASRADFDRLMASDPATLTDLERAARFLQLQRMSFGGKVAGRTYGVDARGPARFDVTRLVPLLEAAHERLCGVWIECLPFADFITRYDHPCTLFFCDPPYWGSEHYYGRELFSRVDFERLATALRGIEGHFIMTVNDVQELRDMFGWATIEAAELTYTISKKAGTPAREIIISN